MRRKSLVREKVVKFKERKKPTVPFEKHAQQPSAFAEAGFIAQPEQRVVAWRVRTGSRPTWNTCRVVRVSPTLVELWDETLEQWFCFDPSAEVKPDVRLSG